MALTRLFWLLIGWLYLSNSSMVTTKKTPRMGEGKWALQVSTRAEVHVEAQEPPALADCPVPERETSPVWCELPTQSELEKRVEEVERLGEVRSSPESSPTQKLAQMGGEDRPSTLGGEEPARRKLQPTMGGKAPKKEFLRAGKVKKPQKYWLRTVALCESHHFQKSIDLLICKLPFSCLVHEIAMEVGKYDMCFQGHTILTLQEAAEAYSVGLLEDANLCIICAQGHTISVTYPWRASALLKTFSPKSVLVFLLVVGCVGFCQYQGWEFRVGFALYIIMGIMGFVFVNSM